MTDTERRPCKCGMVTLVGVDGWLTEGIAHRANEPCYVLVEATQSGPSPSQDRKYFTQDEVDALVAAAHTQGFEEGLRAGKRYEAAAETMRSPEEAAGRAQQIHHAQNVTADMMQRGINP